MNAKGNNPLLSAGYRVTVSSAGNMHLMLTVAKLEVSVKNRKTRSSGKGGKRAKSTGKRNTKTRKFDVTSAFKSHNESWQCLRSNLRGICKEEFEGMQGFLFSNF